MTVSYDWRPNGENKVVITREGNTITRYWDGMGRDLGYTENGDGTILYHLRALDAEGGVKEESSGSVDPGHKYFYLYDASGRVTRITDPRGKVTAISYSANRIRTITDPENRSTVWAYHDLPGRPTSMTDAQGHTANYVYDAVGRLATVDYLDRDQSYSYDGLDHITTETHPETGLITYIYDSANKLSRRSWGGAQHSYIYNVSGQLISFTGAETVGYGYNDQGAVASVTGSAGWSRTGIEYDDFGAVIRETVSIPGLSSKSLSYEYDSCGNLIKTTYPDGKVASLGFNGLDRPESLAFDLSSLVSSASYGPSKMLASLSISGNGTSWSSSFFENGAPDTVSLMKGSTPLYNATYAYDGAGNITGISSTAPAPALNAAFAYDSLNRLISATYSAGDPGAPLTYSYEYDAFGNMLTVRHNGIVAFNKTYDPSNRIVGYSYDPRGNLISAEGKNYVWDAQNRLRAIMDASGQYLVEYVYDDRGLRLASLPPRPDINVTGYPSGSEADFTSVLGSSSDKNFTITNGGFGNLTLGELSITGQDAAMFSVHQQPASPVAPFQTSDFVIRFHPTSAGDKQALLSIGSNDPDENPYEILLCGFCEPEIEIGRVSNGGTFNFGSVTIGESKLETFSVNNLGTATLLLYGEPVRLDQQGGDFELVEQAGSEVPASGSTSFSVRFAPTSEGQKTASITIDNNDLSEDPYTFTLVGTGLNGPEKITEDPSLEILVPNGGEEFAAGSIRDILWKGGETIRAVRIEYSTDNGSAYRTIVARAANIGTYPWKVPEDLSGSCLVRISDADGSPTMPSLVSFEFNFRVLISQGRSPEAPHFSFRAAVPDPKTPSVQVVEVSLAPDGLGGFENLLFNDALGRVQELELFLKGWHHALITYDMVRRTGSVWIDEWAVLLDLPLRADLGVKGPKELALSLSAGSAVRLWIDDLDVRFLDQSLAGPEVALRPLLRDNFNGYEAGRLPRAGGWRFGPEEAASEGRGEAVPMEASAKHGGGRSGIDDREYASSPGSLRLEGMEDEPAAVAKRISLPARMPFTVSAEAFAIVGSRGENAKERGRDWGLRRRRGEEDPSVGRSADRRASGGSRSRPKGERREAKDQEKPARTRAGASVSGTFFIYAFDGRLLAEYDVLGQGVKDYIYFGGRLVAEYRVPEGRLYYYASDQIHSTRVVTDDTGAVVYAAAHEPYGGIQKTWAASFDPELKFSGKPRDAESGLDYFGARYYDRSQYRFLSVDPVNSLSMTLHLPQRWNKFSYCMNNPVNYVDLDGAEPIEIATNIPLYLKRTCYGSDATRGLLYWGDIFLGYTIELPWKDNQKFVSCIREDIYLLEIGTLRTRRGEEFLRPKLEDKNGRDGVYIHWTKWINGLEGCVGYGSGLDPQTGYLVGGRPHIESLVKIMRMATGYVDVINGLLEMYFDLEFSVRFVLCVTYIGTPEGTVHTSWIISRVL